MRFRFVVDVEVERTQGKFATREELAEQIQAELEGADPGQLEGENGGEYEVQSFEVSEEPEAPKPSRVLSVDELLAAAAKVGRIAMSVERMARAGRPLGMPAWPVVA